MEVKYVFEVYLETLSPLFVGGRTEDPDASSKQDGKWIIPASSIKGALTEHLKNHAEKLGEEFVEKICGKQGDGAVNEGSMRLSDLLCLDDCDKDSEEIRTRVSVNRMTGSTEPEALLTYKPAKKGIKFSGKLFLGDKISDEEKEKLVSFLKEKSEFYIGANQTVGLGLVKIKLQQIKTDLYKKIDPGMYLVYYKALSPFVSSEYGSDTLLKKYFMSSKNYIPATTMKKVLKVKRVGYFYPSNSVFQVIPIPATDYFEKYHNNLHSCLKPLIVNRLNNNGFLLSRSEKRLERKQGYKELNSSNIVEVKEITNFHVALSELTRTVTTSFWVQKSVKPRYWTGYVYSDTKTEIPRYITVGAARSKGYGLMELERIEEYDNKRWEKYIEECGKLFNDKGFFVPFVMTSHYFCQDPQKDFGGEVVQSFVEYGEYRFYDPNEKEGSRVKVFSTVLPGSVIVVKYDLNKDKLMDFLKDLKQKGIGSYTELGFGDFEIYPIF